MGVRLRTQVLGRLLKTGQTTQYASELDDGYYEKGLSKYYEILTTLTHAGTTNITINSKTDAHSNNCVFDNRTKLMFSRYVSASVGPGSDGKIPWTTTGAGATAEGIFPYCTAANTAELAGYSDWRIPDYKEVDSLLEIEGTAPFIDDTAFASFPSNIIWTSSTHPISTTDAFDIRFDNGAGPTYAVKTAAYYVLLVRGG